MTRSDFVLTLALTLMLSALSGMWTASAVLGVASGIVYVAWAAFNRRDRLILGDEEEVPVTLLIPVIASAGAIAMSTGEAFAMTQNAAPVMLIAAVALLPFGRFQRIATIILTAGLVLVVFIVSYWMMQMMAGSEIDIVLAHEAGAQALLAGENPYEVVVFKNTGRYYPFDSFEGYPYPPVSLVGYAGMAMILPLQVAATLYVAAFVALLALAGISIGRPRSSLAVSALVAATPALGFMMYSAATESLTSLLFLGSGLLWRRRPIASAILLGLALSSKQYLVVPAVALLFADVDRRWGRIGVAAVTSVAVALPFFAWGPSDLVDVFLVREGGWVLRPDALSLAGLGIGIPTALVAAIAVAAMWFLRTRFSGPGSFFWIASAGLSAMLVLHPHSLVNHWFGLVALISVALVTSWTAKHDDDVRHPDRLTHAGSRLHA